MKCEWPTCNESVFPGKKHCFLHNKVYGTATSKPKTEPIAKQSDSEKDRHKEYKPLRKEFLSRPENLRCALKMEGCQGIATEVHHTRGREGDQLTNVSDWLASCRHCNGEVEKKHQEAKEKGLKKSKFSPKQ